MDNIVSMNPTGAQAPVVNQNNTNSNLSEIRDMTGAYSIGVFGGKERFIKFDLNAFAEMESLFGSMDEVQNRLQGGSMKDIRTIMWLGLIWDEAVVDEATGEPIKYTLSQYQVGSWLNTSNMKDIMQKLQGALVGSMPEGDTEAMNNAAVATNADPNL